MNPYSLPEQDEESISQSSSLTDISLQDLVPGDVAAETEVTTTYITKGGLPGQTNSDSDVPVVAMKLAAGVPLDDVGVISSDQQVLLTTGVEDTASQVTLGRCEEIGELDTSHDGLVTLNADLAQSQYCIRMIGNEVGEMSQAGNDRRNREKIRRDRDKQKKQVLRNNPAFRERERIKARARMKAKRNDPSYRESERARDRMRRKLSRRQNTDLRNKERERDKAYKKMQRYMNKSSSLLISDSDIKIKLEEQASGDISKRINSGKHCDKSDDYDTQTVLQHVEPVDIMENFTENDDGSNTSMVIVWDVDKAKESTTIVNV